MVQKALIYIFGLFAICSYAQAQVPGTLSYQGILTDNSGNPVPDGVSVVTFNFYSVATGGTAIAGATRGPINVTTSKGLFTVVIGDGTANNAALPGTLFNAEFWIGITVGVSGTELTPRVRMTAVPYAYRAQVANTLDATGTVVSAQITDGTIATADLANGSVTSTKLAAGSVSGGVGGVITDASIIAADITDATITNAKLASGIDASKITTGILPAAVIPATIGVPIGAVEAFAGSTVPAGWLQCDGALYNQSAYPALFTAIGTAWGGSGTQFRVPDLRGRFLRGRDNSAGNDPNAASRSALYTLGQTGDNVGSYQGDAFQGHGHLMGSNLGGTIVNGSYGVGNNPTQLAFGSGAAQGNLQSGAIISDGASGTPRTSSETRPSNAYVIYIIKAQ